MPSAHIYEKYDDLCGLAEPREQEMVVSIYFLLSAFSFFSKLLIKINALCWFVSVVTEWGPWYWRIFFISL